MSEIHLLHVASISGVCNHNNLHLQLLLFHETHNNVKNCTRLIRQEDYYMCMPPDKSSCFQR